MASRDDTDASWGHELRHPCQSRKPAPRARHRLAGNYLEHMVIDVVFRGAIYMQPLTQLLPERQKNMTSRDEITWLRVVRTRMSREAGEDS